ncbi:MAG TPA: DipZ protein, partial [Solirubrobacteraceae bacterium]|nr:DipZ protein [Solirubrobacteraceae bacterium]
AYSGPYAAGAVWVVVDGSGSVLAGDAVSGARHEVTIAAPGAYALLEHERHTAGELALELRGDVRCLATCFTPGLA